MTRVEFSNAYKSGYKKTVRFLLSRGTSEATAEESAQAAWAKGWEKRASLKQRNRIVQWVNTIAMNVFRGRYRKDSVNEDIGDHQFAVAPENSTDRVDLAKVAQECSPKDWRMLNAHYVAGYSSAEIADQLDVRPVTVRVRLTRAKAKLRSAFRFAAQRPA